MKKKKIRSEGEEIQNIFMYCLNIAFSCIYFFRHLAMSCGEKCYELHYIHNTGGTEDNGWRIWVVLIGKKIVE